MAAGDITKALSDQVRARLGEASKQGLLDDDIYAHMSRGQYDLAWRLNDGLIPELTKEASGNLASSRATLPGDFLRERLVMIGATDVVARRASITELDALDDNSLWLPSLTNPFYYIWYNITAAAVVLLVDVSNAASTDAYKLKYVAKPTEVDASTDPDYDSNLYGLIVDFAVMRGRQMQKEYAEAERLWRRYQDQVRVMNSRYELGRLHEDVPGDVA